MFHGGILLLGDAMRRLFSALTAICLLALTPGFAVDAAKASNSVEMNLDQTILVWNDENYPDFSNYNVAMSTVSTLTGDAAQIGYTFEPALDPGPCPAPFQQYNFCGGPLNSAALNPITRQTFGLVSGADAVNSSLYIVDPQTGLPTFQSVLTLNGAQPFNVRGIFFDADGNLYAWWQNSSTPSLLGVYSVDIATGAMTLEQNYLRSSFTGGVVSITLDPSGQIWAFSVSGGNTNAATISLTSTTVNQEFGFTGTSLIESSFDSNGYLWFVATGDKLYTLDVSAADPAASLEFRANLPALSGAFVISDVPFPTTIGVESGETLTLGTEFGMNIANARAGSGYTVEIHSTPVELASGNVAPTGGAFVPLTIPASVGPGSHEIVISYIAPNGRPIIETYPVTVTGLAATGVETATPTMVASTFLLLGFLAVFWAARSRAPKKKLD